MARRDAARGLRRAAHVGDLEATASASTAPAGREPARALAAPGRQSRAVIAYADAQPGGRAFDANLDGGRLGMPRHVGEAFLDDPVQRHVDLLAEPIELTLELERAAHARVAPLPLVHQVAQRVRETELVQGDRAQPLHEAARHVVHPTRHVDDRLRALGDLSRRRVRVIADHGRVELDRVEALAELVVQLAREAAPLLFLREQILLRQPAVLGERVGELALGGGRRAIRRRLVPAPPPTDERDCSTAASARNRHLNRSAPREWAIRSEIEMQAARKASTAT
jgi:hypothetical protein